MILKTFSQPPRLMLRRLGSRQCEWMFKLIRLWIAGVLFIASNSPSTALAQTTDSTWTEPLNLSHSGVATDPAIVIDSEAVVHAVWQDDLGNFIYTQLDGDQWSAPEMTELDRLFRIPAAGDGSQLASYAGPNPLFIAGPGPYIFAFWISPEGKLFTSKVTNQNFQHVSAWDPAGAIASDVASFSVTVDSGGEWNLAFLHTVDAPQYPAGIYYTRSRSNGWNWAPPVLLSESTYFRSLGEGEANLSVATAGTKDSLHVYVAWDNRPRKQVLLIQSPDNGKSWGQPALIAGPTPDLGSGGPFNIHVGTYQNRVMLVWQSGQPGGTCSQLYQSSRDEGATWSDPKPIIQALLGCTQSNEFVTGLVNNPSAPLYFLTETQSQVYLSAWNGLQWSEPQEQSILTGFEDPEIFTQVDYGCHRASLLGTQLYIVGCDEGGGGDVWVTSRDLGSNTSWFSPPIWSQPAAVSDDSLELESVKLVSTDDGLIHAFLSQRQDPAIYYTSWDGESWSHITPVLKLPDGEAGWPAIETGSGNELFLIAPNNRGTVYYSRATSGEAATESSWSAPTRLEVGQDGEIGSVDVASFNGTVYLAYSVPLNEARGIYLVQSQDNGTSWSEPKQVFDGAAAGFDLVGAPSLLISENGFLHIIWKQQLIQGDGVTQPVSLYYTRSEDGGQTFNDAERVVEEPVAWQEIMTDGKGHLHLLWQQQDTLTTVWDQVSLDDGNTWEYPKGLADEGGIATVTRDPAGRLNFVSVGTNSLGHWLWDGDRWQTEAPLDWSLSSQQETPVEVMASVVNKQGKMMVVLSERTGQGNTVERHLLYSIRTLETPTEADIVQEIPTQTLLPPTSTPTTLTPEPSLTSVSTVESEPTEPQGQADLNETNNRTSPFTMALIPVALLLLSVLAIVIRRANQAKE